MKWLCLSSAYKISKVSTAAVGERMECAKPWRQQALWRGWTTGLYLRESEQMHPCPHTVHSTQFWGVGRVGREGSGRK